MEKQRSQYCWGGGFEVTWNRQIFVTVQFTIFQRFKISKCTILYEEL